MHSLLTKYSQLIFSGIGNRQTANILSGEFAFIKASLDGMDRSVAFRGVGRGVFLDYSFLELDITSNDEPLKLHFGLLHMTGGQNCRYFHRHNTTVLAPFAITYPF